jgi:hypothetical protein
MTGYPQVNGNRGRIGVRIRIGVIACAAAAALSASLPSAAHHSFAAEFDASRAIKVTGVVSEVEWMNPHGWIHLSVNEVCERTATPGGGDKDDEDWMCRTPDADEAAEWGFELGSPNGLMRQGWTRNSLSEGDTVTIEGSRARDDSHNGNARIVTTADGKRLFAGSSQGVTP